MLVSVRSKTATLSARACRGVWIGFFVFAVAGLAAGCGGAGSNGGGGEGGEGGGGGGGSDTTPPAAPSGLAADAADEAVGLSWDAVDEADAYRVYRSTSSTSSVSGSALEGGIGSTTYEDPTVKNGTTYYYRVTAVDEAGNESEGSSERSSTPFAVPSGLAGTSGDAQVELGWNEAAGARQYNVYRSTGPTSGAEGDPLATAVAGTTYVDETAENGTKYYYRVTALNPEEEESAASNEIGKTPFSDPPDRP